MGDEQLDVVVIVDAPEAGLAAQQLADLRLARSLSASLITVCLSALLGGRVDLPGAGLEAQAVLAIVEDAQLLAEGELLLARVRSLALAAPHTDQRQECEQAVVQVRAEAQVGGVLRDRQVAEDRQVLIRRALRLLGGEVHGLVAVQLRAGVGAFCRGVGTLVRRLIISLIGTHGLHSIGTAVALP